MLYICILRTVAVSLFESSSAQHRSNEDLEGPECSKCIYIYMYIYMHDSN